MLTLSMVQAELGYHHNLDELLAKMPNADCHKHVRSWDESLPCSLWNTFKFWNSSCGQQSPSKQTLKAEMPCKTQVYKPINFK